MQLTATGTTLQPAASSAG